LCYGALEIVRVLLLLLLRCSSGHWLLAVVKLDWHFSSYRWIIIKIQNFNESFKKGVLKYFKKFTKFMKLSNLKILSHISSCILIKIYANRLAVVKVIAIINQLTFLSHPVGKMISCGWFRTQVSAVNTFSCYHVFYLLLNAHS